MHSLQAHLLLAVKHEHILSLAAVTSQSCPFVICIEYPGNGDLQSYLRACRPMLSAPKHMLTQRDLYAIVVQVAAALEWLESKQLLHPSPTASAVFVGADGPHQIKLGNIAAVLTRDAALEGTGVQHRPPVRWQAPELLQGAGVLSAETMLWSFGVLVWEVSSLGRSPWGNASDHEVEGAARSGERPVAHTLT